MRGRVVCAVSVALCMTAICGAALGQMPAPTSEDAKPTHPDFGGIWQTAPETSLTAGRDAMAPLDGEPIPFQPWSKALHDGAVASETKEFFPWPPNNQRCLVAGMVRAMKGNFPWRFIETKEQITLLFEEDGRVMIIPFKDKHAENPPPTWYGDPIARWDGDTLVIDVKGFNGKTPFPKAIHHTTLLRVTHRIRLIEGGAKLEDQFTIDDPGAYTRPWTARTVWVRRGPSGYKLRDYRCAENNRDLPTRDGPLTFWQTDWGPN